MPNGPLELLPANASKSAFNFYQKLLTADTRFKCKLQKLLGPIDYAVVLLLRHIAKNNMKFFKGPTFSNFLLNRDLSAETPFTSLAQMKI